MSKIVYSNGKVAGYLINGTSIIDGIYEFDGVNDFIDFGNILNDILGGTDNKFTMEAWIKPARDTPDLGNGILVKHYTTTNERQLGFVYRDVTSLSYGGLRLEFFWMGQLSGLADNYRAYRNDDTILQVGEWYHVAVTYDGSQDGNDGADRVDLYVNGVLENKVVAYSQNTLLGINPSAARLSIGAGVSSTGTPQPFGAPGSFLDGGVSSTKIYDRVLTPQEVLQNYNAIKGRFI